ncbi:MAG: AGE family epimerase/isomerase [Alphaproteobacteria bacterium]|nr:AGE family epimerase/isomerase [Alphaproteobacteria bacterium]
MDHLSQRLLQRWVPKWYEAFHDTAQGGFHERLGHAFQPVPLGYRRLVTQCRQLALYSHATLHNKSFRPDLNKPFEYLMVKFLVPETGGWRFSIDDDGKPLGAIYDLYGHAFVIFAMSHYYRATGEVRAQNLAQETRQFIERHFRMHALPGYAEALDEKLKPLPEVRRQNPHMHLLEACLFAAETWDDPAWMLLAGDIIGLFKDYFYRREENWLCEFFTDSLNPHPDQGRMVEPGHYCEWVWLLKKHARLSGDPARHDRDCASLLRWANKHGWDAQFGGIYDIVAPDGTVVKDSKRLWPFTEALKANALMLDAGFDKDELKARIADMVGVFREGYMDERGFWTEWLTRDLSPAVDYMPGTTPYHVYFGIMETRATLAGRGPTKSWRATPAQAVYSTRRMLSGWVKRAKALVKARN